MRIQVSAIHFSLGDSFRTHAEERLASAVSKYTERAVDASMTFAKDGQEYQADASAHLGSGLMVQAQGRGGDVRASLDQALERLEKQLRRYKRRVTDHRSNARSHKSA